MTWATLIPIIAQYGLPLAESLFQKWTTGAPPTQADFTALLALANQNASAQMKALLTQNNIDPASPQGQAFLALVQ